MAQSRTPLGSPAHGNEVIDAHSAIGHALLEHPDDAIVVLTPLLADDGDVVDFLHVYATVAAESNAGQPLVGRTLFDVYSRRDATLFDEFRGLLHGTAAFRSEFTIDGSSDDAGLRNRVFAVYAQAVNRSWVVVQYRDITVQRMYYEQLREQALHDGLTGLPNRRLLDDRLTHAVARLAHHPGCLAVLYCDLDNFKAVNDSFGHDSGDLLLRRVGTALDSALRAEDTVARMGGDEFVVVLEDAGDSGTIRELAHRIRADVLNEAANVAGGMCIDISIGIAATHCRVTPRELLARADAALYRAKRGSDRVVLYDDSAGHCRGSSEP